MSRMRYKRGAERMRRAHGAGFAQVIAEDTRAKRELGIRGVPHFVVAPANADQKSPRQLGGAQPSTQFLDAFAYALKIEAGLTGTQ